MVGSKSNETDAWLPPALYPDLTSDVALRAFVQVQFPGATARIRQAYRFVVCKGLGFRAIGAVTTDCLFTWYVWRIAGRVANNNQAAFLYQFTHVPTAYPGFYQEPFALHSRRALLAIAMPVTMCLLLARLACLQMSK